MYKNANAIFTAVQFHCHNHICDGIKVSSMAANRRFSGLVERGNLLMNRKRLCKSFLQISPKRKKVVIKISNSNEPERAHFEDES
jgi:hypothetical protein